MLIMNYLMRCLFLACGALRPHACWLLIKHDLSSSLNLTSTFCIYFWNVKTRQSCITDFLIYPPSSRLILSSAAPDLYFLKMLKFQSFPNLFSHVYWHVIKFVYKVRCSRCHRTECIYVWIRKHDHYECPEIRFILVKISSFQIIKKWQRAVFFFSTQKIAEIWRVRNVQGGRLTEGVEVG